MLNNVSPSWNAEGEKAESDMSQVIIITVQGKWLLWQLRKQNQKKLIFNTQVGYLKNNYFSAAASYKN